MCVGEDYPIANATKMLSLMICMHPWMTLNLQQYSAHLYIP